jgi:Tfp pilus assembly protein PilF
MKSLARVQIVQAMAFAFRVNANALAGSLAKSVNQKSRASQAYAQTMGNSTTRAKHAFVKTVGVVSIVRRRKTAWINRAKNAKMDGKVPVARKRASFEHAHRNAPRKAFVLMEPVSAYMATKDVVVRPVSY